MEWFAPQALADAEGADEADALLALWTTLTGQHYSADAMAHVAQAYRKSTGPSTGRKRLARSGT